MRKFSFFLLFLFGLLFLCGCGDRLAIRIDLPEGMAIAEGELKNLKVGNDVEFVITPEPGKTIDRLIVNGVDITFTVFDNKVKIKIVEGLTISLTFKNKPSSLEKYTVTLGPGLSSTDTLTGLSVNSKVNITITIPEGKEIYEFKVDEKVIDLKGALTYQLTVSKNHNVVVIFKTIGAEEPDVYTVTWKNYDGMILETDENVLYGATPTYDGNPPTKPGGYTFIGWTPEPSAVTKNIEYTALFSGGATVNEDFIFYDLGDGYAIYKYHGQASEIVIPETYEGKPVILIDKKAFQYNNIITSVIVPNSVTEIKEYAFYECQNLKTVTLGNGIKIIGDQTFNGCKLLSSINLPEGLTRLGEYSLSRCAALTSLNIPNSIESFGYSTLSSSYNMNYTIYENGRYIGNTTNPHLVFVGMVDTSLEEIKIHDNCKIIGDNAFAPSYTLRTIDFGKGVQIIGSNAFNSCSKLGDLVIPKTVKRIESNAFANSSITHLGFEEYSVIKYIGSRAFSGCHNLTTVHLSNSLESIGEDVFKNSDSINKTEYSNVYYIGSTDNPHLLLLGYKNRTETSYTIHANTKLINHDAFNYCNKMTTINIPSSVRYIGPRVFKSCFDLTHITVDSGNSKYSAPNNTAIIETATGTLISGLNNLVFPSGVTHIGDYALSGLVVDTITVSDSVVSIGEYAFSGSSVKAVTLPDSVTSIGKGAFYACINLTTVNIPSGLRYIDQAVFRECIALNNVDIPNFVSYIGREAFIDCGALDNLTLRNGIKVIAISAFDGCDKLEAITIPDSVEAIEYRAFAECKAATSITIGKEVKIIEEMAFLSCNALTTLTVLLNNQTYDSRDNCNAIIETATNTLIFGIKTTTIPDTVTTIGESAFYKCNGIENIVLGDSVTKIEKYAFYNSTLQSITLRSELEYIGDYAFQYCANLTSIVIPDSVTYIGYNAFQYCINVKIYCENTTQPYDWALNWNSSNRPVYWYSEEANYDGSHWRYVEGIPTVWAL